MSAQNLPKELKDVILEKVNNYKFKERDKEDLPFYINHMLEKDLWNEQGKTFMQYLDDLDSARNISWQHNFQEMELEKYDPR
jgi:hypothetical protein